MALRRPALQAACGANGPSCSTAECQFTGFEMRILEKHAVHATEGRARSARSLFTPPKPVATKYSPNGWYNLTVAPHLDAGSALVRSVGRLLHDPVNVSLCASPYRQLCRLGKPGIAVDGGWTVCQDMQTQTAWTDRRTNLSDAPGGAALRRRCHVFSFGINDDPSFDVEVALSWGCVVHMFDHTLPATVRHVLTNLHPDLHYHPLGLTARASTRHWRRHDHSNKFGEGADFFVSLPDAIATFAEGGVVDVLKLDCEGCEWTVFEELARHTPTLLNQIGQIAIEIHAVEASVISNGSFTVERLEVFLQHVLGDHRFAVAHRHLNLASLSKFHHFADSMARAARLPAPTGEAGGDPLAGLRGVARATRHLWAYWELLLVRTD